MGLAAEAEAELSFEEMAERNLIGGEWRFSREGYGLDIYDPANSTVIAAVPLSTRRETDRAIEAALRALGVWSQWSRERRLATLRGVVAFLRGRADDLAQLTARDSGLPRDFAKRDLDQALARVLAGLESRQPMADVPAGLIAQVLSWSSPLVACLDTLAASLANGDVAILKPSMRAPLALVVLGEAFQAAGAPGGVLNLLQGAGRDVGASLVRRRELKRVEFHGSRVTAMAVQRATKQTEVSLRTFLREVKVIHVEASGDAAAAAREIAEACNCHGARAGVGGVEVRVARGKLDALVAATRAEFARAAYGADPRKTVAPFIEDKFRALCAEARQRYLANGAVVLAAAPEPDQRVARMGWFLRPLLLQDAAGKIVLDPEAPNGPTAIIRVI